MAQSNIQAKAREAWLKAEHDELQADPYCPDPYRKAAFIGARWSDFLQGHGLFGLPNPRRMDMTPIDSLNEDVFPDIETAHYYRSNTVLIKLKSKWNAAGAGVFIAPNLILTAAHNADFFRTGSSMSAIQLRSEGVNGRPGRAHHASHVYQSRDWTTARSHFSDLALIRIKRAHEDYVDMDFQTYTQMAHGGVPANAKFGPLFLSAFWGEKIEREQRFDRLHLASGAVVESQKKIEAPYVLASHDAKTMPGWSGAPVYVMPEKQGVARLSGIHVHGDPEENLFAAFTPEMVGTLSNFQSGKEISRKNWPEIWRAT